MKNYDTILGVGPRADADERKAAARRTAERHLDIGVDDIGRDRNCKFFTGPATEAFRIG